jgi:hypothetical protein
LTHLPEENQIDMPCTFSDEELRIIQQPVLLPMGDHEVIYKPADAIHRVTHQVSGLKAEMVPNANHWPQFIAHEYIKNKILEFFSDQAFSGENQDRQKKLPVIA